MANKPAVANTDINTVSISQVSKRPSNLCTPGSFINRRVKKKSTNRVNYVPRKEEKKKEVRFAADEVENIVGADSEPEEDPNSPTVFFKRYHEQFNN